VREKEGRVVQPEPVGSVSGRYLPALDGVRALAIAAVFAYHLGYRWAAGGYLGVDLFFVLSGFLITSLLVEEWAGTGRIDLVRFWGRRARRLLPALLAMLLLLSAWVAFESGGLPVDLAQIRGDALATVLYVANWHLLFAHQSYFDRFAVQSPLKHTWSLAIEEQFYLVWPLVILTLMRFARPWRRAGLALTTAGALASAAWMAWLWTHGASVSRVYYGTDTRAFDLLVGASLAMLTASNPQPGTRARRALRVGSMAGLAAFLGCAVTAGSAGGSVPSWMFEGGLLACALAAVAVIADVRQIDQGVLARLFSLRPVRYVGAISYGLYLWHWPVIVELTTARTGQSGLALSAIRVGAAFGLSAVSYRFVEQPIRRWAVPGRAVRARTPAGVVRRAVLAPIAMAVTSLAIVLATIPPAIATAVPHTKVSTAPTVPGAGGVIGRPIALGHPTASRPLRILLLGDSVMLSESPAIEALLGSTGVFEVTNHSQWGWGLSQESNWRTQVTGWVQQSRPDLVIAMWSWDNTALARDPAAYRATFEAFVRELLQPSEHIRGLILQEFPIPGTNAAVPTSAPDYDARVTALVTGWNDLAASLPALFPGRVMYLPLGPAVLRGGRFATWLPPEGKPDAPPPQWTRVRQVDNIHFCPDGAARYAAALLADLDHSYRLPKPAPHWWTGSWTTNYLAYRFPNAGVCPDDHP
jgi:peptidoglycan/LPS O-acetylase OafA/YrhL